MAKNKNINPLERNINLNEEIDYHDFEYKNHFTLLCNLIPNKSKERIEIEYIDLKNEKTKGLVYVFVIEGKILKIGQTINTIKDRIGSYNCGKIKNRISGTASTTNYFILQSILNINKIVKVYAMFPDKPEIELFGEKVKSSHPPVKVIEKKLIIDFEKKYGKKPIGITQK